MINRLFQDVGCDGVVGSGVVLDKCGVCGGDERTCGGQAKFEWQNSKIWSACDKTCGYNRMFFVVVLIQIFEI